MLSHYLKSPAASILGPVLCNAMYDEVLWLELPVRVEIAGFADDITLKVYGESIEEAELTTTHSIKVVEAWMKSRKLELAHHQTEVMIEQPEVGAASGDRCKRLQYHVEALRQTLGCRSSR